MRRLLISSVIAACCSSKAAYAISPFKDSWEQIKDGAFSSFSFDLEDKLNNEEVDEWEEALKEFSVNVAYHFPLKQSEITAEDRITRRINSSSLTSTVTWNPISYWQANLTLYQYINDDSKQSFNPDFTYSFGYSDWHPYTLSLMYSNYGGNRFNPDKDKGEKFTRFYEGTLSLGWRFVFHDDIQNLFKIYDDSNTDCGLGLNVVPKFQDPNFTQYQKWKTTASVSCKYTITDNYYVNFSAYYYPFPEKQMPWDPDFTYGFGYFDWRKGTLSVQYNNYAGNRFPWNANKDLSKLDEGTISISYSLEF